MDDLPAAHPAGVEVAKLVGGRHFAVGAGPVVDAGVAGDRPPPTPMSFLTQIPLLLSVSHRLAI